MPAAPIPGFWKQASKQCAASYTSTDAHTHQLVLYKRHVLQGHAKHIRAVASVPRAAHMHSGAAASLQRCLPPCPLHSSFANACPLHSSAAEARPAGLLGLAGMAPASCSTFLKATSKALTLSAPTICSGLPGQQLMRKVGTEWMPRLQGGGRGRAGWVRVAVGDFRGHG